MFVRKQESIYHIRLSLCDSLVRFLLHIFFVLTHFSIYFHIFIELRVFLYQISGRKINLNLLRNEITRISRINTCKQTKLEYFLLNNSSNADHRLNQHKYILKEHQKQTIIFLFFLFRHLPRRHKVHRCCPILLCHSGNCYICPEF